MIPRIHLSVTIHSGLRTAHTEHTVPIDDSLHLSICYHPQRSPQCSYRVRYSTRWFPASIYLLPSTVVSAVLTVQSTIYCTTRRFPRIQSICYHPQWSPQCSYKIQYTTRRFPASIYLLPSTRGLRTARFLQFPCIHLYVASVTIYSGVLMQITVQ